MVKNAITVFARVKPENKRKGVVNYKIHRRPKKHLHEDFLVLTSHQKFSEYIDNRPESWNFSFSRIFGYDASQDDVFESVARPVVNSVFEGYNATILAYGQTGSGKTYTITGEPENPAEWGILPRTLQYVFDVIQKNPENLYSVEIAYLEIYNENGYDLLLERKQRESASRLEDLPRVTIQEDESGIMHLKNLSFRIVENAKEALRFLVDGDMYRAISETPMNPRSSRSHCIFTIVVSVKKFGAERYTRAKMHLVDLAGSERVYKCAIQGAILTEAKHINLSLHFLEQVIVSLGQGNASHVPYRNSLLTSILRDSIGGNCLTTMLATISVSTFNLEETISTCRFAQRVALVRNDVNLTFELDARSENTLLRMENERLRNQVEELKKRVEETFALNSSAGNLEYYKNLVVQRDQEISHLIDLLRKERSRRKSSKESTKEVFSEEIVVSQNKKNTRLSPRNDQNLSIKVKKRRENSNSLRRKTTATSPKRNGSFSPKDEKKIRSQNRSPIGFEVPMLNLEEDYSTDEKNGGKLLENRQIGSNIACKINTKTERRETKSENFGQQERENTKKENLNNNNEKSKNIDELQESQKIPIDVNLRMKNEIRDEVDTKIERNETILAKSFSQRESKETDTENVGVTDHKESKADTAIPVNSETSHLYATEPKKNERRRAEKETQFLSHEKELLPIFTDFDTTDSNQILETDKKFEKETESLSLETELLPIFTDFDKTDSNRIRQSDKKSEKKSASEREKSPSLNFPRNVMKMMRTTKSDRQDDENLAISSPKSATPKGGFKASNILRNMLCKEKNSSRESSARIERNNESMGSKKNENDRSIVRTFENKPLPLTGDPEIDEEIIAFYKAKRSGGTY